MKNVLTIILLATLSRASIASTLKLEPGKGQISYVAKGRPAFISIKGTGEGVEGTLIENNNVLSGEVAFNLTSLSSGIDLRDEHLKIKYLEVEKFPKATLKILDLQIPIQSSDTHPFSGMLNLHGVEQKIDGTFSIKRNQQIESIYAEFKINLNSFKIIIPSFQGITVAEEVLIKADLPISKIE